ncbi:hypothetical protein ACHAQD_009242 [Fusarium lateritium]
MMSLDLSTLSPWTHSGVNRSLAVDDAVLLAFCLFCSLRWLRDRSFGVQSAPAFWFEQPQKDIPVTREPKERNVANLLTNKEKDLTIFWGSQSGTSERLATQLSYEITSAFSKNSLVVDLSDIDLDSIEELPRDKPVLFILSTYGEGDPSDNAAAFFDWLKPSTKKTMTLDGLPFSVLGLGNSTYKYYNQFGRIAHNALQKRGAQPLLPLNLADDAVGLTEEHFWSWQEAVFRLLQSHFGFVEQPRTYHPTLEVSHVTIVNPKDEAIYTPRFAKQTDNARARASLSKIFKILVVKAQTLTPNSTQGCLHMELDISSHPELKYDVGDHIGIWPQNLAKEIEALRVALGISSDEMFEGILITQNTSAGDIQPIYPEPTTLHALFSHHLDICHPISRKTIMDLEQFVPSNEAKQWIRAIAKDQESYIQHKAAFKITLSEILLSASSRQSWNIPLSFILETLPSLNCRYYSIASAPIVSPRQVSITVKLLSVPLHNDVVEGVSSAYLNKIQTIQNETGQNIDNDSQLFGGDPLSSNVFCHVRKSKFKPPVNPYQPMIMIATGTGITPFRAFLQHRARLSKMGKEVGKMMLFFGCRDGSDTLYEAEIAEFQRSLGRSLEVIVAYSRSRSCKKAYVQDKIQERKEDVVRMIADQDAKTSLCGSTKMARDVKQVVGALLMEIKGWSNEKLVEFQKTQMRTNQWQEDVWG